MLSFAVLVLSLIGLWISIYFTGVYYKWFAPNVFWIPQICQLKESNCMAILETPRAKLYGIPNSVFGITLYLYLVIDLIIFPPIIGFVFLGFALVRSIYLAYSLLFVTKVPCPLCFTSHAINLVLFFAVFKLTVSS